MNSVIWFVVGLFVGIIGTVLVARNNEAKAAALVSKIPGK